MCENGLEAAELTDIPNFMHAMVLEKQKQPLHLEEVPVPKPGPGQVLIKIQACGVCRTDLHIVDGELLDPKLPLIIGHEIIGSVAQNGEGAGKFKPGDRIGVPWLGWTDGTCKYCLEGRENLCVHAKFTGYNLDGGYAEYTVADQRYCFPIHQDSGNAETAPLMCAGLIGYRTYRMAGENIQKLGIYGFGGAAHIITQIALYQGKEVYAFTSPGDREAQDFAKRLGVTWAGDSTVLPPVELDAALIFAPVGALVPEALKAVAKGGVVVCGGIHMSDIPSFPYAILWGERTVRSVANLTRRDGEELLAIAPLVPVHTEIQTFPLDQANEALNRLRKGKIHGAAVLVME